MTYEEIEERNERLWDQKQLRAIRVYKKRTKDKCRACKGRSIVFVPCGTLQEKSATGTYICARCNDIQSYENDGLVNKVRSRKSIHRDMELLVQQLRGRVATIPKQISGLAECEVEFTKNADNLKQVFRDYCTRSVRTGRHH